MANIEASHSEKKNRWWLVLIVLIVGVGIWARLYQYQFHFAPYDDLGVVKSIFDLRQEGEFGLFAVPTYWNYSPFQFLITPFLISLDDSYRQMLIFGRLPSVIASILGIGCLIGFYFRCNRFRNMEGIVALTIFVCSLEHIIFSKQMHNYALGVTAVIGLLWIFIDAIQRSQLTLPRMIVFGLLVGILSTMQYSVLFFIPAFYFGLFNNFIRISKDRILNLRNIIISAVTFIVTFSPVWFFFLRNQVSKGNVGTSDWNRGEHFEFFFQWPDVGSLWSKVMYAGTFFVHNGFLVLSTNTAFLPENHPGMLPVGGIFFVLLILGVYRLFVSRDSLQQSLGVFIVAVGVTWVGLVILQKLTLSPTRHNLILLPLMAVGIASGLCLVSDFIQKVLKTSLQPVLPTVVCSFILMSFLWYYPGFCQERRDPFNEEEILAKLKEYQVDALIPVLWTLQAEFMPSIREYYDYNGKRFIQGFKENDLFARGPNAYKRLAWLSRRQPLTAVTYQKVIDPLNYYVLLSNRIRVNNGTAPLNVITGSVNDYRVIYQDVRHSDREIEYRGLTKSDTNGFYFYILERK